MNSPSPPTPDPDKVLAEIQADLDSLTIDEIKDRLHPLFDGMVVQTPVANAGTFLYRGRLLTSEFTKGAGVTRSKLGYPPADKARAGRVNRAGEPMLYCSISREAVFYELDDLRAGSELIISNWQTTHAMLLNNIGYTQPVFDSLGAKRPCPTWAPKNPGESAGGTTSVPGVSREKLYAALDNGPNGRLRHILSELFARRVTLSESNLYKLSAAIAERHLGSIFRTEDSTSPDFGETEFSGLLYPSIGMWGNSDNVALRPAFADAHLKFLKATHVRIDRYEAQADGTTTIKWTGLDCAAEFDTDGRLKWLGRLQNWTVKPLQQVQFTCRLGPYPDGDYEFTNDGKQSHWDAIDGVTGEPVIRE